MLTIHHPSKHRGLKIIGAVIGIAFILLIIARITGMLTLNIQPTGAMEPTINIDDKFLVTNLVEPERNDIVVFRRVWREEETFAKPGEEARFCYRLVGLEGDIVELKNGYVYINGKYADDSTRLKFPYMFDPKEQSKVLQILEQEKEMIDHVQEGHPYYSVLVSFKTAQRMKRSFVFIRDTVTDGHESLYGYDKGWNNYNYGPLLIPKGHFFVLGDNRTQAKDSRYVGPQPMEKIDGVVIKIF